MNEHCTIQISCEFSFSETQSVIVYIVTEYRVINNCEHIRNYKDPPKETGMGFIYIALFANYWYTVPAYGFYLEC